MLRSSLIRTARASLHRPAASPSSILLRLTTVAARANSTSAPNGNGNGSPTTPPKDPKTPEELARKAALKHQDHLQSDWDARVIAYEDFLVKTQNPTPGSYIIDVREPDEVIQGMIPSAVNLPLSVLGGALHLPHKEFVQKYGFEKPQLDQEVVFYCRSGKRSTTACDVAKRNGYTNILNYKGSWLDWVARQNEKTAAA